MLATGCAKYSKQEIASASYDMRQSKSRLNSIESKLRTNDAYSSGSCSLPRRGTRPAIYVTSQQEAKEYATAFCYSPVLCDVSVLAFDVDGFTQRFLTSEACGVFTDALRADGQITRNTQLNFIEAVTDSACDNDIGGFWGGLLSIATCIPAVAIDLGKMQQLENCLDNKHKQLYQASRDWENAPGNSLRACNAQLPELSIAQRDFDQKQLRYNMMVNY